MERIRARQVEMEQAKIKRSRRMNTLGICFSVLVIFLAVFYPLIIYPSVGESKTISIASQTPFAPSDSWYSTLSWMRENTPEPFGSADSYYELYKTPFQYPDTAYGVTAWWDYGYWISRIARRLPNANPGQAGAPIVARFFTAQDEGSASEIRKEMDSSYVVIDYETAYIDPATASSKFGAITLWAGRQPEEFFGIYYIEQEDSAEEQTLLAPVIVFYPEYYRSLAVRLYNFDGKAVTPEHVWVISYQEQTDSKGNIYKRITGDEYFTDYEEAQAYVLSQESGNYRIIGTDPMLSPVPLEAVEHYRLVHSSENITLSSGKNLTAVKVFEYVE